MARARGERGWPGSGRRAGRVALVAYVAVAAFACAGRGTPGPEPEPRASGVEVERAVAALQEAEALYGAGDFADAARRADSLFRSWREDPGLTAVADRALWLQGRAEEGTGRLAAAEEAYETLLQRGGGSGYLEPAAGRLAALRLRTGEPFAALEALLATPGADGETELETAREAVGELGARPLEELAGRFPAESGPVAAVIHTELARARILEGRTEEARDMARRVLAASPAERERELASLIAEAGDDIVARALRIGVVLPLSGRFSAVGELLREGIELAVESHRRVAETPVEMEYRDDGSDPERAVALAGELEEEGALAVIGPVRSESFAAAARNRRNRRLLMISPTATDIAEPIPNVYTMSDRGRGERDAARTVAAWIVRRLGLPTAAVLHPDDPVGRAVAEAFRESLEESGGTLVGSEPYRPEWTTFEDPIAAVAAAEPDAVYVAAASVPSLLQLAPQLFYFGIDRSVIAGGPTWTEPAVVRRLEPAAADYRVVGTYVDRTNPGTTWSEFKTAYERRFRKSLGDNLLPGLSHDAALLVLAAAQDIGLPLPGALSDRMADLSEVEGVTGVLTPDPSTSTVARSTRIRLLVDRRLTPAEPERVLTWLEEARARADSIEQAIADSIARARADTIRGGVRR